MLLNSWVSSCNDAIIGFLEHSNEIKKHAQKTELKKPICILLYHNNKLHFVGQIMQIAKLQRFVKILVIKTLRAGLFQETGGIGIVQGNFLPCPSVNPQCCSVWAQWSTGRGLTYSQTRNCKSFNGNHCGSFSHLTYYPV